MIHQTAIVDPEAKIAENVSIGPFSLVGAQVEIGEGTVVESHVVIKGPCKIGKHNRFFQFGSIGEECQDKKYNGEPTLLEIGDNNVFRECVTVHRGTVQDRGVTKIGSNNLFMAYAHIAHDCEVGNNTILANNVTLAGHVDVHDNAILGGMTAIHQFCRVGRFAFIGGGSIILRDVPPFVMIGGKDSTPHGINSEGLRRNQFDKDVIMQLKRAYKALYRSGHRTQEAVEVLNQMALDTPQVKILSDFLLDSARGIVR